jgi:L-ribulokinase
LSYRTVEPDPAAAKIYDRLYALYKKLYFGFGQTAAAAVAAGDILPTLRRVAAESANREV